MYHHPDGNANRLSSGRLVTSIYAIVILAQTHPVAERAFFFRRQVLVKITNLRIFSDIRGPIREEIQPLLTREFL